MSQERVLAAIMFTDIVGYTALMGKDSAKALELIRISKEIQKPLVEKHNGKWLKEMGDGAMAQFNTALDAVNCSIEIQEIARGKLDAKLRIGIHLGDVTVEENDVLGDGVNVASRLESIADPGGIYISDAILKAIQGQRDVQTKYLGEISLKNVAYDVRTYAIQGVGLPVPEEREYGSTEAVTVEKLKRKFPIWTVLGVLVIIIFAFFIYSKFFGEPKQNIDSELATQKLNEATIKSIAVLPFDDFSPEGDQEWLSNGLMEAITNNLTNIKDLRVIARTTMMQYKKTAPNIPEIAKELNVTHFLQGSVMRYEENIRINIQLISAESNSQQWTQSFDQKMSEIFNIMDEVAISVGSELEFQLKPDEIGLNPAEKSDNIDAYELYLQAKYESDFAWGVIPPIVKDQLEEAISLDSSFVACYVYLGYYWQSQIVWDGDPDVDFYESIQNAKKYLNQAIAMDPGYGDAYVYLGFVTLFYDQELIKARELMQKGVDLNPSSTNKQALANTILPALGEFEYARTLILEAMNDSPLDPGVWSGKVLIEYFTGDHEEARKTLEKGMQRFREGNNLNTAARVYFGLKDYRQVIQVLNEYLNEYDGLRPSRTLGYLAAAYYNLGNLDEFQELLNELKQQAHTSPAGSPSFHIAMIYAQMQEIDTAFEWLDKAYEDHEVEMYWLKVEPPFEPLHDDPRWQEMLDKVGFPD